MSVTETRNGHTTRSSTEQFRCSVNFDAAGNATINPGAVVTSPGIIAGNPAAIAGNPTPLAIADTPPNQDASSSSDRHTTSTQASHSNGTPVTQYPPSAPSAGSSSYPSIYVPSNASTVRPGDSVSQAGGRHRRLSSGSSASRHTGTEVSGQKTLVDSESADRAGRDSVASYNTARYPTGYAETIVDGSEPGRSSSSKKSHHHSTHHSSSGSHHKSGHHSSAGSHHTSGHHSSSGSHHKSAHHSSAGSHHKSGHHSSAGSHHKSGHHSSSGSHHKSEYQSEYH
ncbi:hypothetical protein F4803DRAFT_525219 [Xylaria telfairii]|nr:hypothetical protein F4803DRAFT_525219 [Xylaria telfairii]